MLCDSVLPCNHSQVSVSQRYWCIRVYSISSGDLASLPVHEYHSERLTTNVSITTTDILYSCIVSQVYWWKVPSERLRFGNFPLSLFLHGKNEETYRESFETRKLQAAILTSKHLRNIPFEQLNFSRWYSFYFRIYFQNIALNKIFQISRFIISKLYYYIFISKYNNKNYYYF